MPSHPPATPTGDATASARRSMWVGVDQANAMGVELIAAILTWSAIGWFIDRAIGTAPIFLIVGALVGNSAGLYLVWWRSGKMRQSEQSSTPPRDAGLSVDATSATGVHRSKFERSGHGN